MIRRITGLLRRLKREDGGQDLIEYALLTIIVTLIGFTIFSAITTKMSSAYVTWGTSVQTNWDPSPPLGSGS